MGKDFIICPGCGVSVYTQNQAMDNDFNASAACRELVYQLSYYTLSLRDPDFIHQLVVDAYAASHYGPQVKPITITFALIGLFLACKKNYTGKQVQQMHIKLARSSKIWPSFRLPKVKASITVKDVLEAPANNKSEMIKKWAALVWGIWESEEAIIVQVLAKHEFLF